MPTNLPLDSDHNPIQVLRPKLSGGAHKISPTATAAKNASAFGADTRAILVQATQDITYRLGDNTVAATVNDHFLGAGVPLYMSLGAAKAGTLAGYLSVVSQINGTVYITELE